jgi:DNA-binding NtrC family response regulator
MLFLNQQLPWLSNGFANFKNNLHFRYYHNIFGELDVVAGWFVGLRNIVHVQDLLVVDDVESQRDISSKMLETLGYDCKAFSSGEEAIEYLKENKADLIVLDMIMDPGINGRETYERVIKIHPTQKAIIVSGFAETEEVTKTQQLGAGKYIKKPLTLEKIGVAVKEELMKPIN